MASSPQDPRLLSTAPHPRRTVATYDSYGEAQAAVDLLSDRGFPVEHVAIVGQGLRYVEQVAGRMTTGRAAAMNAAQGALLGLLFALLLGAFFTVGGSFGWLLLYGLIAGGVFGALVGAATHSAFGGQRDFASVAGMQAERYEVQVDDEVAGRAAEMLAGGVAPAAPSVEAPGR